MKKQAFIRRKNRVRSSLKRKSLGRLRLSVTRTNQHIYAQVIDDATSKTIASASTLDKELVSLKKRSNIDAAKKVGELVASRAVAAKVKEVVLDRGGYLYHGRVKALADAAREGGLKF